MDLSTFDVSYRDQDLNEGIWHIESQRKIDSGRHNFEVDFVLVPSMPVTEWMDPDG